MTPPAVGLTLTVAFVCLTLGFVSLLRGAFHPACSLQARVLPGIALTFVGGFLYALPMILAK